MSFTTWTSELERWKNALSDRNIDSFFIRTSENSNQMRTVYNSLGDIQKFTEWLEQKASMETTNTEDGGYGEGSIFLSIGGA
jgi:hypothetical protein